MKNMKKFLACFIILCFALPSQAAFWNKKNKALEKELQGKGYAGTLPNIESKAGSKQTKTSKPAFDSLEGFDNPADLKPVPADNPAFIDIIKKKDRTSEYVNDANAMIPLMEKLVDTIEDDDSLQMFVTRANVVTMNADYLNDKYQQKPESYYESFKKLQEVSGYIKSIVTLRQEAVTYQRYLAYSESGSGGRSF